MVLEIELISKTYSITFNEHDSEMCSDGNKKLLYLPNDTAYKHATMQCRNMDLHCCAGKYL